VKILKMLVGAWFLLIIVAVAIAITNPQAANNPDRHTGHQVVSDLGQLEMLDSDQQMLQGMRGALTPNMVTMIESDPMWTDPDMIRLQEQNQAQLDRMIGKRPGQP
jgi:hypothetical protein